MIPKPPLDKRRLAKRGSVLILALFVWSLVAAPQAQPEEPEVVEPTTLVAYDAIADAAPIIANVDHQVRLLTTSPGIAKSTAEVSLPSEAKAIAYLVTLGVLDGANGTTTGTRVPTESSATQPGGADEEEFKAARDSFGNGSTLRYGAGVSHATALHADRPRAFANAHLFNLVLLPAPGSPQEAPGTYDPRGDAQREDPSPSPGATPSPDDPKKFTPNPPGQMGILTIGSLTSASETVREEGTVISIGVAELNGISIGNRTADNRCTNCITIDSVRIEAFAQSDGTKEGAFAATRLLIHRACRVAISNDARTGDAYETVRCLNPNPDEALMVEEIAGSRSRAEFQAAFEEYFEKQEDPNAGGVRKVKSIEKLNEMFESGLGDPKNGGLATGDIGLRLHLGNEAKATVSEGGQLVEAHARGLEFEVRTAIPSGIIGDVADQNAAAIADADKQCTEGQGNVHDATSEAHNRAQETYDGASPPSPLPKPTVVFPEAPPAEAPCPGGAISAARAARTIHLTLGSVGVSASARPGLGLGGGVGEEGGGGPAFPSFDIPPVNIPSFNIPSGGGGNNVIVNGGGLGSGRLRLVVDWSSIRLKPWPPMDMAKAIFTGALVLGFAMLLRRRLRPH
jgi:hypothetical protein